MRAGYSLAAALLATLSTAALAQAPAAPSTPASPPVTVTTVGANINITPRRLTFDKTRRSATVYLYNQGGEPATVDVTLVDRVMKPDGQIILAEDAAKSPAEKPLVDKLKSAQSMIQVAPRRVMLAPGKGQTVRLRVGNIPETADNVEYRSHLTVTTIPPRDAGTTAQAAAAQNGPAQLSFHINAVYGLSIPVIIRTGAPDVRAGLENMHVETENLSLDGRSAPKPTPVLIADLVRAGVSSLYGNLDVRPVGAKDPIGVARGVGVYTEIGRRTVRIPLSRAPNPGEKLEVTFTDDDTSPGKVLAKSAL